MIDIAITSTLSSLQRADCILRLHIGGAGERRLGGPGGVPVIPASQRIPEVILDTTTMGHEAVVVKNGLCGTGAARGSAPILQDKAYWEVSE